MNRYTDIFFDDTLSGVVNKLKEIKKHYKILVTLQVAVSHKASTKQ